KVAAVRELARERGYDLADSYAYSDSISDLPLLEAVGHPTAVNPDRALRKAAEQRGWAIREFRHPVPLRQRLQARRAVPVAPARRIGVGLAAGVAWSGRRGRNRAAGAASLDGEEWPSRGGGGETGVERKWNRRFRGPPTGTNP